MNWYYTRENIATKVNNNHMYEVLKQKNIYFFISNISTSSYIFIIQNSSRMLLELQKHNWFQTYYEVYIYIHFICHS